MYQDNVNESEWENPANWCGGLPVSIAAASNLARQLEIIARCFDRSGHNNDC